jgi:osmotically-inducible protein OsmY
MIALAGVLGVGPAVMASTTSAGANDAKIEAQLAQKLQPKAEFKNVRSTVENGTVTLTGTVESYKQKADAEKLVRKTVKDAKNVRDLIEVAGPTVPDAELQQKLARSLAYDREGYLDSPFNVLTLAVKNGVVTLGGEVADYPSYTDALAIVANTKGVKDVVNQVKVAPTSFTDDNLRLRLYRAIYGDTVLSRYGMDPSKPIRILVDNGHVALYGKVDNQADVSIPGIRARQVFGAFSVENHLTTESAAR